MDTITIVWWQYPMLGIGALLFANGVVAFNSLSNTISSKILLYSQMAVAVIFLVYPFLRTF